MRTLYGVAFEDGVVCCLGRAVAITSFDEYKKFKEVSDPYPDDPLEQKDVEVFTTDYDYFLKLKTYDTEYECEDSDKHLHFIDSDEAVKNFFAN